MTWIQRGWSKCPWELVQMALSPPIIIGWSVQFGFYTHWVACVTQHGPNISQSRATGQGGSLNRFKVRVI